MGVAHARILTPRLVSDRVATVRDVGDLVFLKLGPRRGCVRATSAIEHYERGLALETPDATGRIPDILGDGTKAMSPAEQAVRKKLRVEVPDSPA